MDVEALLNQFHADLAGAADPAALEDVRRAYTGKKSPIKAAFKTLRSVPDDQRSQVAAALNAANQTIAGALDEAAQRIAAEALAAQLDAEWADLSMPGQATRRGARHPLTEVEDRCLDVLRRLGFELVDGPEIDAAYYNFDALNIPEHHPARDCRTPSGSTVGCSRSHTTVQARVLEAKPRCPSASQAQDASTETRPSTRLTSPCSTSSRSVDRSRSDLRPSEGSAELHRGVALR